MAQMNISNTLFNDTSTGEIAYVEQLKDRLLRTYIANNPNYSDTDKGRIPASLKAEIGVFQEKLNEFFLDHWVDFQRFLLDEGVDPTVIDSWKEVQEFLEGLPDDETMWLKNKLTALDTAIAGIDQNGIGTFDVSAYNNEGGVYAQYADLAAALAGVPIASRRSGMAIRFIDSDTQQYEMWEYKKEYANTTVGNEAFTTVSNWYGFQDTDAEPTAGSVKPVQSGGVQNELALGAVYDVSAKNPTAGSNNDGKWESLSALLSDANLNTLIPISVRKGGMSVKYVQSSDHKYVQYRLMAETFSTTVSDWQGVDNEPIAGSNNLVKSGGVAKSLIPIIFYLSDDVITEYGSELTYATITYTAGKRKTATISSNQYDWRIRLYTFAEDTYVTIKCTNPTINAAIFDTQPSIGSTGGTIVLSSEYSVDKCSAFIVPAGKYLAVAHLNNSFTYELKYVGVPDSTISDILSSISNIQQSIGTISGSITGINNDITGINNDITKNKNNIKALFGDVQDINGIKLDIDAVQGQAITYTDWEKYCYLPAGTYKFIITGGEALMGDGYRFLYVLNATTGVWAAPKAFSIDSTTGELRVNVTFAFDVLGVSFATAAANVIGTGKVTMELSKETVISAIQDEIEEIKDEIEESQSIITAYNNIPFNQTSVAEFLVKYKKQIVDEFNQLNVAMAGDSIFGRLYGTELPYTPDMNDPEETDYGYQTGHFPPNMWAQNVPFKVLQYLQYKHADVKYYNNRASEITKSGTWTDAQVHDGIYITHSNSIGDYLLFSFTGATFLKLIFSDDDIVTKGAKIKVTFSTDNGSTWNTPDDLSLVEKFASDANDSGVYTLTYPENSFKFGNQIWKGFNKNTTYKVKVEIMTAHEFSAWGFETWSNPRINVEVTAEGGNQALHQKNNPSRFYSSMYGQDLVIYELPFLNDLGTGMIPNTVYKGKITPTSSAPASPEEGQFYYCNSDGIYTNFGGLQAYKGDYISYKSSQWVIGSEYLDTIFTNYVERNTAVFEALSKMGVPLLTLTTHGTSGDWSNRPFTSEIGLPLLRGIIKEFGFANIDVYAYHMFVLGNTDIWSDGTHLDANGVAMYESLIKSVVTLENALLASAFAKVGWKSLVGESSSDTVTFGFEFKNIPNVEVFNTTSRIVTSVTKRGFTTTGSGNYKYRVSID